MTEGARSTPRISHSPRLCLKLPNLCAEAYACIKRRSGRDLCRSRGVDVVPGIATTLYALKRDIRELPVLLGLGLAGSGITAISDRMVVRDPDSCDVFARVPELRRVRSTIDWR